MDKDKILELSRNENKDLFENEIIKTSSILNPPSIHNNQ